MLTFDRIRRALLQGMTFFAAIWIIDDLSAGIGTDRVVRYLIMAVAFAAIGLCVTYYVETRFRKPGKAATLHGTLNEVGHIIRSDKQPADPSGKS